MKSKIIALVFGLLALVLEVLISIKNPTVESIVAAAFALVIVISMIVLLCKEKVVELTEDKPAGSRLTDKGLKFANEIAPYIKEKNGKLYLKVIK